MLTMTYWLPRFSTWELRKMILSILKAVRGKVRKYKKIYSRVLFKQRREKNLIWLGLACNSAYRRFAPGLMFHPLRLLLEEGQITLITMDRLKTIRSCLSKTSRISIAVLSQCLPFLDFILSFISLRKAV